MTLYLHQFSYSTESVKGMIANPHDRREAAAKIFGAAGGKLIDFYFCLGDYDGVAIAEFPSTVDATAAALTVSSSGAFSALKTSVLIPMDDAVKAMQKAGQITGSYTPPSG